MDFKRNHLELLLLSVLKRRPMHGYAVISALCERSSGLFELAEGSAYPTLHRLEQDGLIASEWDEGSGRKRRLYAITPSGRAALADRTADWHRWSDGLNRVLQWSGR